MQVGVVFGIQLMQTVQQARVPAVGQDASYHWGYLTGLAMAVIGVVTATRIASATASTPGVATSTGEPAAASALQKP